MKGKKKQNGTWLIILMVISQIMLTGLIAEWLKSQWNDEKLALQKDVGQRFSESENQVLDSMLVRHLIAPVLKDSSAGGDKLITFNKKIPVSKEHFKHASAYVNDTLNKNKAVVTIALNDSAGMSDKSEIIYRPIDSAEKKMLLRSVKLIIRQTGDSTGRMGKIDHFLSFTPDTFLLKQLFKNKIDKPGWRFNIMWISDSVRKHNEKPVNVMYFRTNLFQKPVSVEIRNYHGLILKRISVQILFSIALLLSTASAFIFTYRSLEKQKALNILRDDFINNISHELKTPVSTISIALEALKNFDMINDRAKTNEYLDIAVSEMKRLDQLISQVMSTSMLEDQGDYLKPEMTSLVSLVGEALGSMQVRFEQHNAKVNFNSLENITLSLDKLHVMGVLINILDNSLKYATVNPEIIVKVEQVPSEVIISICDNGPGIPEEYISRVFDKFFRVPSGDIHNIKGYGLGLSFAELVMKQHGGSIEVRNRKEGGCEFILTFPLNNV